MDLITQLIILIFVGIIGGIIAKKLKLPVIIGYIVSSAVLTTFSPINVQQEGVINNLAQIGVTLLLFSIGMDFSLEKLLAVKKYALIGGILQIVLTIIFGMLLFPLFKFSQYESLFLGAVFAMSSTAIVIKVLEDKDELDRFSSEVSIGWLILQDIAVVFLIILLGSLANTKFELSSIFSSIFKSFLLIAGSLIIGRKILPKILTSIASLGSKELVVISAFGFSLLFAYIAERLGVSSTLGAFLAGLMISDSILNHEIITEIKPLQAIFSLLFFITIGSLFSFSLLMANLGTVLFLLLIIMSLKLLIVLFLSLFLKLHFRVAFEIAINLAQVGEFAFLSSQIGLMNHWISSDLNTVIFSVTILSLLISPFLILNIDRIYQWLSDLARQRTPFLYRKYFSKAIEEVDTNKELKNHIIICGYGRVGKYLAMALKKMRQRFVIIEMNNVNQIENEANQFNFIVGDSTNGDILKNAGIENAKIVVITLPKGFDVGEIIRLSKGYNPDVQLIIRKHHETSHFEDQDVFAVIEPEFEATIKMLEKLISVLRKKDRKILSWVREQKKAMQ